MNQYDQWMYVQFKIKVDAPGAHLVMANRVVLNYETGGQFIILSQQLAHTHKGTPAC